MKKFTMVLCLLPLFFATSCDTGYKKLDHQYQLYAYGEVYVKDMAEPDRYMNGCNCIYYNNDIPFWSFFIGDRYGPYMTNERQIASKEADILYKYNGNTLYIKITDKESNKATLNNIKYIDIIKYRNIF